MHVHVHVYSMPIQVSEYEKRLSEAHSQISHLRSQLSSLEQSTVTLQHVLDERSTSERQREAEIKGLHAELNQKTERLSNAESKVQV